MVARRSKPLSCMMKGMWMQLVISLLFYSCTLSLAILLHPSPADFAMSTLDTASNSQVNNLAGVNNNNNNKRKLTARIYRELHRLNKPPVKTIQVLQQLPFLSPLLSSWNSSLLFSSLGFFSSVVVSWNPFSFFSSVVVFSWVLLFCSLSLGILSHNVFQQWAAPFFFLYVCCGFFPRDSCEEASC